MKRVCVQLWLLILLVGISTNLLAQDTIRIAVGEWPPYVSADLPGNGLAPRIVTEAFALEGVTTEYVFVPWKRAYIDAQHGDVEATLLWVRTPEREQHFEFSDVVITGTAVFFHLKSVPFDWKTVDDLAGLRIGGLLSASYPWFEEAKKSGKTLTMDLAPNEEQTVKKLLGGRIDIFSLDLYTAYGILNTYFTPEERALITYHPTPIEQWEYCLMFSKRVDANPHLLSLFNKGLQQLKDSGRYDQLLAERQQGTGVIQ